MIPDPRAARSLRFARTVDGYHLSNYRVNLFILPLVFSCLVVTVVCCLDLFNDFANVSTKIS